MAKKKAHMKKKLPMTSNENSAAATPAEK
jgi:hypothetical protein